jgi:soluble lytic murein transglycosylase
LVFHADLAAEAGAGTPARPSAIPGLERRLRGSELDRHALLGLALAAGDMRGTLAVAVNLPGRGLAPAEMMPFLYPLPADGVIRDALLAADTDPALILAVARNESLFEPTVRSRAGALGFMQIMPFHYPDKGARPGREHWSNPALSIARGDRLLVENMKRYDGDPYRTTAAYNAGPQAASRWTQQLGPGRTDAMYLAWIGYPETRHYVEKVLIDREIYDAIIEDSYAQ